MMSDSSPIVQLEALSLSASGRTLSAEIFPEESYAVMGPSQSGKTQFLKVLAENEKPIRGTAKVNGPVSQAHDKEYSRRATPATLAKTFSKGTETSQIVQVLTSLNLWELKDQLVQKLTPSQIVLTDLLPCFLSESQLVVIDGHLDYIDPWTLEDVLDLIEAYKAQGKSFVVATSRPDIAERLENIIVFKAGVPKFIGTIKELVESSQPVSMTVHVDDSSTVLNVVDPFVVSISATKKMIELTSHQGQELAALLLTKGYGNVKSIIIRPQTIEEALKSIF